jgi:hypothetical protein
VSVYLIGESQTGPVKIGKSANPKRRLGQLQVSTPYRLRLFCTVTGYAIRNHPWARPTMISDGCLEKLLHAYFSKHRIGGEWFSLSVDEIAAQAKRLAGDWVFPPTEWDFDGRLYRLLHRKNEHYTHIFNEFQMENTNGI